MTSPMHGLTLALPSSARGKSKHSCTQMMAMESSRKNVTIFCKKGQVVREQLKSIGSRGSVRYRMWEIRAKLGVGTLCEVHELINIKTDKKFACKIIRNGRAKPEEI